MTPEIFRDKLTPYEPGIPLLIDALTSIGTSETLLLFVLQLILDGAIITLMPSITGLKTFQSILRLHDTLIPVYRC